MEAPPLLDQNLVGELDRKTHDVHGEDGSAAHGIYVAQGVGGGHLSEGEGVVDDRRKEVHGLDQGQFVIHLVDGGVVSRFDPHQKVGIGGSRQLAQDLRQFSRTELGGSTSAAGEARQARRILELCHLNLLSSYRLVTGQV